MLLCYTLPRIAASRTTEVCVVQQALPMLSPERGFPLQKTCSGLLLNAQGRLLAAGTDGCCYLLDAESLQQEAILPLHPSQTGKLLPL